MTSGQFEGNTPTNCLYWKMSHLLNRIIDNEIRIHIKTAINGIY